MHKGEANIIYWSLHGLFHVEQYVATADLWRALRYSLDQYKHRSGRPDYWDNLLAELQREGIFTLERLQRPGDKIARWYIVRPAGWVQEWLPPWQNAKLPRHGNDGGRKAE